ncbi:MAG: MFS transporter [Hyphomicrobiales bacterium]|nr:MFS transporter [Hyphomicrobiales bacterium]
MGDSGSDGPTAEEQDAPGGGSRAIVGWVMFDWAAQPYFTLITTFVFAPYFVAHAVGDPVQGQKLWGYAVAGAGAAVAVLSPVLGAIADAGGRRKPWIAASSLLFAAGGIGLWWAVPGLPYGVLPVLAAFIAATVGAEVAAVFTNAMLPDVAPPSRIGRISGLGWAVGYMGGLTSLAVMLILFLADPIAGRTVAGLAPLLDLDPAAFEGDRFSGPFSAIWYLVFVVPLFAFVPDRPHQARLSAAVVAGMKSLRATLVRLAARGPIARYLVARMIYTDGLSALFAFGGAYAAATFDWQAQQVGLFGVILIIAATIGAGFGGRLDDRLGSRRLILTSLVILAAAAIAILSVGRDHVGFVVSVTPADAGRLFNSMSELAYLAAGCVIGIVAGPIQSASRTLLVRLAPKEEITEYFGLYALVGKATAFLGPLMIGAVTAATGSLRLGMSVILLFLVVGYALLRTVPDARAE